MNKKTIIEGVGFILMVVTILTLLCVLYEVNELKGLMRDASNFRSIANRKQNMLNIKNINKILNKVVDIQSYIRGISLIDSYDIKTKIEKPLYLITIWNTITNTEMKVYLERNSFLNDFYGLYAIKNGNKQEQLLRIEWIKDMNRFLKHIRAFAID